MEKYFDWADVEGIKEKVADINVKDGFEKCVEKGKNVYDEYLADTLDKIKEDCKETKEKVESFFEENEKAKLCAIIVGILCVGIIIGCIISKLKK